MRKLYHIIFKTAVILLCIILFLYAIIEARTLLYPLVIAMLFAYLLFPVGQWLEKKGCSRILANCIIISGCFSIIFGGAYLLYSEASLLILELPELREQAERNIHATTVSISSSLGIGADEFRESINKNIDRVLMNGNVFFDIIFPSTTGTLMALGLMPVYIFLFLYYRNKLYNFLMMIWPDKKKASIQHVIEDIAHVTKRYMSGVFTVVLILCFLNTAGLMIIGVKFALFLGIISALFSIIPYFGIWIGAIFPLAMAIFTGESPQQAMWVVVLFIFINFIENNILTPNITGGSVQVNPLVTIIGMISAGMVWGLPGMFAIIPLLGMLKIALDSDPSTRPIGFLIGTDGTAKHAITFHKIKNLFRSKGSMPVIKD